MNICINVPSVVYSNSWTGQTSALSSTTLATPSSEGLYRLSIAGKATFGGSGGGLAVVPTWLGSGQSYGTSQGNYDFVDGGGAAVMLFSSELVILGQSGVPISFSTVYEGPGPTSYDIFVTLEQLQ